MVGYDLSERSKRLLKEENLMDLLMVICVLGGQE